MKIITSILLLLLFFVFLNRFVFRVSLSLLGLNFKIFNLDSQKLQQHVGIEVKLENLKKLFAHTEQTKIRSLIHFILFDILLVLLEVVSFERFENPEERENSVSFSFVAFLYCKIALWLPVQLITSYLN